MLPNNYLLIVPKNTKATCLNDYRPVALTSIAMKCFERLVMAHINIIIPENLDPLQFAYCPNRSTNDQIKSNVFMYPFVHQLISQSAVQKPSLKPQTASNAGVEARWLGKTP